jgi:type IV secretory pathway VirB9-like protein
MEGTTRTREAKKSWIYYADDDYEDDDDFEDNSADEYVDSDSSSKKKGKRKRNIGSIIKPRTNKSSKSRKNEANGHTDVIDDNFDFDANFPDGNVIYESNDINDKSGNALPVTDDEKFHMMQNLHLKHIIRENHGQPISQIILNFERPQDSSNTDNLVLTVGSNQVKLSKLQLN